MDNKNMIEMLRNPELRNEKVEFVNPAGESDIQFVLEETKISPEALWTLSTVTYSSVPCAEISTIIIVT